VKEEADIVPEVDLLSCLDGFSLVIGAESDVIYVSTNVSSLIGLRPAELLGQTLADYIHPYDQVTVLEN
jgi:light-regulated signal transduction histidine kinase (bacteriophytochrome)